jgi:hypothetical protein
VTDLMRNNPYSAPLLTAFLTQIAVLALSGMVLDRGYVHTACRYASVGFWLGVVLVLCRRPASPQPSDLAYIRWGLPVIVVIAVPLFLAVWHWKGVS